MKKSPRSKNRRLVLAKFSRPNIGGALFSQTVVVNKLPGGEFFLLVVHEKITPLC